MPLDWRTGHGLPQTLTSVWFASRPRPEPRSVSSTPPPKPTATMPPDGSALGALLSQTAAPATAPGSAEGRAAPS